MHPDIETLQIVANKLGELLDQVVFVGGATTKLYIDDPGAAQSIATLDIDCIVEISNLISYEAFDMSLNARGEDLDRSKLVIKTIAEFIKT